MDNIDLITEKLEELGKQTSKETWCIDFPGECIENVIGIVSNTLTKIGTFEHCGQNYYDNNNNLITIKNDIGIHNTLEKDQYGNKLKVPNWSIEVIVDGDYKIKEAIAKASINNTPQYFKTTLPVVPDYK